MSAGMWGVLTKLPQGLTNPIKRNHSVATRDNKYQKMGLRAMLSPPRLPALHVGLNAVA